MLCKILQYLLSNSLQKVTYFLKIMSKRDDDIGCLTNEYHLKAEKHASYFMLFLKYFGGWPELLKYSWELF